MEGAMAPLDPIEEERSRTSMMFTSRRCAVAVDVRLAVVNPTVRRKYRGVVTLPVTWT